MSEALPTIKDSPNDRVLNVFQGVEPLLIKYIETNPEDKELAKQVLANVRKALSGNYGALPEPNPPKVKAPVDSARIKWGF